MSQVQGTIERERVKTTKIDRITQLREMGKEKLNEEKCECTQSKCAPKGRIY